MVVAVVVVESTSWLLLRWFNSDVVSEDTGDGLNDDGGDGDGDGDGVVVVVVTDAIDGVIDDGGVTLRDDAQKLLN